MTEKLQVAIVGLGLIGTSAGLALRRYQDKVTVIGHDRDPGLAAAAKKAGAVDRTEWNLINTVSEADRVLLALPLAELRPTLEVIAKELKPGCVLVDTAEVKAPVLEWARELLPEEVHFIGGHPILLVDKLDPDAARADLFDKKLFCLTADARTNDAAVRLAADIAEALGAKPFFLDALEHDGLSAALEALPTLLAAALVSAAVKSPSWSDMRKLAGSQFYTTTLITSPDAKAAVGTLTANREQLIRWIDQFTGELGEWREWLAAGDDAALGAAMEQSITQSHKWVSAHMRGTWDVDDSTPALPTSGSIFRDLFGFGRMRQQANKDKQKRK